ncbi:MAG: hypothetical protein O3A29_15200 [Planctomycetota bacterium]|nr:hypothetical protein [Planctomycetota bacterium]
MQTLNQGIECQRFISKKSKHAADIVAGDRVDLDDSASILLTAVQNGGAGGVLRRLKLAARYGAAL